MFSTGRTRWRAPVRHHRSPRSRTGRTFGALGVLAAVLVAGGMVVESERTVDQLHREFVVIGATGEVVTARTIRVGVTGARAAAEITDHGGSHDTAGVWVVVRVRVEAVDRPAGLGYAAVRDSRGRTYRVSARVDQPLAGSGYELQPGIPVEGDIVFEVPADAAGELTVRLAEPLFDLRMQAVAEIPLPLDQQGVAEGLAATEPVPVDPDVTLVGPTLLGGESR